MKKLLCLLQVLPLTLVIQYPVYSQEVRTPINIGEGIRSYSELMEEDRVVIVATPSGYDRTDEAFPVLYLLDGGAHFQHTTAITSFLAANLYIPRMIVVAINSPDRRRDLTPPTHDPIEAERMPMSGGADKFQQYIAEELMPWVEENYRVHPYNVLVGHSHGGLFALQSMITKPELFDAYLAISPSIYWNRQALVGEAERFFETTETLPVSFYMSAGNEGRESLGGMRKLSGVLDAKAPQGFIWDFEQMPFESHGSISLLSIYKGLEFIFQSWSLRNPYEVYENFGIEAIENFHEKGNSRYGFERSLPITTFASLLGESLYKENLHGAIEIMDRFYESVEPPVSYVTLLADALRDAGRQDDAARYYREVLTRDPGNENASKTLTSWDEEF